MYGFATEVQKRNSKRKTLNNSRSEHPGGLLHLGELHRSPKPGSEQQDRQLSRSHILDLQRLSLVYGFPMPLSAGLGFDRYGSEDGVRGLVRSAAPETCDPGYRYLGQPQLPDTINSAESSSVSSNKDGKEKKNPDNDCGVCKRRRESNKIANRKYRAKAKQIRKDTEQRVAYLVSENDFLRKRIDFMSKNFIAHNNLFGFVAEPQVSSSSSTGLH